jgi:RNA-directed DNA polymerase
LVKIYKHLFAQICSCDNLWLAFHRARKGKRDMIEVATFEYHMERNLFPLERELREGTYRLGGYRHCSIFAPKQRKISAAPFRDRVVHHAPCNVIEPIFDQRCIHKSCACPVGKGTHTTSAPHSHLRCYNDMQWIGATLRRLVEQSPDQPACGLPQPQYARQP